MIKIKLLHYIYLGDNWESDYDEEKKRMFSFIEVKNLSFEPVWSGALAFDCDIYIDEEEEISVNILRCFDEDDTVVELTSKEYERAITEIKNAIVLR